MTKERNRLGEQPYCECGREAVALLLLRVEGEDWSEDNKPICEDYPKCVKGVEE